MCGRVGPPSTKAMLRLTVVEAMDVPVTVTSEDWSARRMPSLAVSARLSEASQK